MNVSIVGAGYVGLVTGLCLAEQGHTVSCVDIDEEKIDRLASGVLPIHEAGLDRLLDRHLGGRFLPTIDLAGSVHQSDLTMITVGTPIEANGINLRYVAKAAAAIGRALADKPGYHVVVVKSTVVPGTTDELVLRLIEETSGKRNGCDFGIGMNPEFLREGQAVDDFQNPDRIVLGGNDDRCLDTMSQLYSGFPHAQQIRTNLRTAEMIKYASNALLATLISFSNEIANLCTAIDDVDAVDVLAAVHLDRRISPVAPHGGRVTPGITSYLRAGCGFGGSCFPKDVRALIRWGAQRNRPTRLLTAVVDTNDHQWEEMIVLLKKHFPSLLGRRVAVLGLAFKPDTDDIRESPALRIIPSLTAQGAQVVAYDPVAVRATRMVIGDANVEYASTLAQAVRGAEAIILLTAWPEFQELPNLLAADRTHPVVVDGRRALDKARVSRYEGIGLAGTQGYKLPARPVEDGFPLGLIG